jgi:hypothetical protein
LLPPGLSVQQLLANMMGRMQSQHANLTDSDVNTADEG